MKSKPIDLACPVESVHYQTFVRIFRKFEPSDRYFHVAHKKNRLWYALWDWDRGVWVTCRMVNILVPILVESKEFTQTLTGQ